MVLEDLNEKQREAVSSPRKPVLLIAGPGTGKTRTLIGRIIYEIENHHIPPEQILALTFSNKAANEINKRLVKSLKNKAEKIRTGTFHSFCLDVLRKYYSIAGLPKNFSVCDEEYQKRLIKQLIVSRIKENVEKKINGILLAFSSYLLKDKPLPTFSANIFDEYNKHLSKYGLVDYDQILVKTLELFTENPDILNQYRFLNQSILVDEFQDTDAVQYQIVKLLAEKHRNIFVVADDDQSIYAWRGANPANIRQFMTDFNIKDPIFLDTNYRSGQGIMDTAQKIVQSTDRIEPNKIIRSSAEKQARVEVIFFDDEEQELQFIINKINYFHTSEKIPLSEIVVIYPRHVFGQKISSYLLRERIPHQQAVGKNLIDHPIMQKVILYLKLIREPADALILEELVESELGYHIFKQVQEIRFTKQISFRKALSELSNRDTISYDVRRQINTLIGNVANLVNLKTFFNFDQLINEIIKSTQELNVSVLSHNAGKLKKIDAKRLAKLKNMQMTIWVYHSDPRLLFLATKLLEMTFKQTISELTHEKLIHLKKEDLVIILEPFPVENLVCDYVTLFPTAASRRVGIISNLYRWLQVQLKTPRSGVFNKYVVFDLETTGKNPETNRIVEIAAVKVRDGQIIDQFQSLANPGIPIDKEATEVHHISDDDVKDAPSIAEIWPGFINFIEDDLLIAHNGYAFDFKIIDRAARELKQNKIRNTRYDSLILARNIFPNAQNSIDGLVDRFKLDAGKRHRALDDVIVLHEIFQKLLDIIDDREISTLGEDLTEFAALGNMLENQIAATEDKILFTAGIRKLLSPYSAIRKKYAARFAIDDVELVTNLRRIKDRIAPSLKFYDNNDDFFKRILETAAEFNKLEIDVAIAEFLSHVALVNPQDTLGNIDAVSLLTYHSAKGLEFEKVIIVGVEDEQMPSFFAYKSDDDDDRPVTEKLEEQKRLFYVGITRAKAEVYMTLVKNRFGRRQKSSPFLDEIKNDIELVFKP